MPKYRPQIDRCAELRERINTVVSEHHMIIGPASEEVRVSGMELLAGLEASMETRRMMALVVMGAAANGLLSATARDLDMPLKEVEDVYMEIVTSTAWRRVR